MANAALSFASTLHFDVVCIDLCGENREAILLVEDNIILVDVDACDFYLFSRLATVNQIVHQNHILVPRQTTRLKGIGRLLQCDTLIVAENCLFIVQTERTAAIAVRAATDFDWILL